MEAGAPFLAIAVFPVSSFRHSAIYVNKTKGNERPEDLNGKTIGELALYGHDAGVMPKGVLSDEFGFDPHTCHWVIGGIDFPINPNDWLPKPVPRGVEVKYARGDDDLGEMLEAGKIDALIAADTPKCVLEKRPTVGRLFEDYEAIERDHYRRTGIFPIMHLVAIKKDLAGQIELTRAVYKGFCEAKGAAADQLVKGMTFNNMTVMIPWLSNLISRDRDLLGDDRWPYGVKANRKSLNAYLRYYHEQGLSKRRFAIGEFFVPSLLET